MRITYHQSHPSMYSISLSSLSLSLSLHHHNHTKLLQIITTRHHRNHPI
ncbi:hypothetical protein HanXRQr2_Chr06g0269301 [Helianthus annuus]|uniref:Uncharacterized protein n=1 Tax=Helianthus annuus TaxID=4232 RepID=A0A9K3IUN7_HELAN|nr:hypothetical protein HanXRQr2_Chr06g0269301 [Helianthus annuus]KAJ0916289.1 hypothetical protein HanPSC8_Chr06g0259941 [Helianthus annuus]